VAAPGAFDIGPDSAEPAGYRTAAGSGLHDAAGETTWRGVIDRTIGGLGAAAGARLRVFRIETRHAMQVSLVAIVAFGLALLLLVTGWFALVGALVTWAVLAGFHWPWVLLALAAACVLLGWIALRSARASLGRISFDATARALHRSAGSVDPASGVPR
jgi:uncharacterized membrane protein YqjE